MRYKISGANPENLVSADNFAFSINLLSVICYLLSVVRLTTFKKFLINYDDDTNHLRPAR